MKFKKFLFLSFAFLLSFAPMDNIAAQAASPTVADTPAVAQSTAVKTTQPSETAALPAATNTDTNLIGTVELRKLDFSTPQNAKDTIIWLLTTLLAILFGYSKTVKEWAAKDANLKGLRIGVAIVPVIVVGLLFGFKGDWLQLLWDTISTLFFAGGAVGIFINPLVKSTKQYDVNKFDGSLN